MLFYIPSINKQFNADYVSYIRQEIQVLRKKSHILGKKIFPLELF